MKSDMQLFEKQAAAAMRASAICWRVARKFSPESAPIHLREAIEARKRRRMIQMSDGFRIVEGGR